MKKFPGMAMHLFAHSPDAVRLEGSLQLERERAADSDSLRPTRGTSTRSKTGSTRSATLSSLGQTCSLACASRDARLLTDEQPPCRALASRATSIRSGRPSLAPSKITRRPSLFAILTLVRLRNPSRALPAAHWLTPSSVSLTLAQAMASRIPTLP